MLPSSVRSRRFCGDHGGKATASAILLAATTLTGLVLMALRPAVGGSGARDQQSESNASSRSPLAPGLPAQLLDDAFQSSLLLKASGSRQAVPQQQRRLLVSNVSHLLINSGADRSKTAWLNDVRFHPASFLRKSSVLNESVYCDKPLDSQLTIFYSEPTWLCRNIRVGKRRLPFTDTTTRTQDELTMYRRRELELSGPDFSNDKCGRLPDRGNNVFLLCELLLAQLRAQSASPPVTSSVHVPFGNCSLPEHGRAILVGETAADAAWHAEERLWPGFVTDIFCSFALR